MGGWFFVATLCVGIIFYKYDYGLSVFYFGFIKSVKQIANTYTFYIVNPGLFAGRRSKQFIYFIIKNPQYRGHILVPDVGLEPTTY